MGGAAHRGAGNGEVAVDADTGHHGAISQTGQQAGGHIGWRGRSDGGAGDHRGHERAGGEPGAELLDDDHELGETEAGAAVLLGDVQTQPSELGQCAPERRHGLGVGLEELTSGALGVVPGEEVGGDLGECAVVLGDGDGHGSLREVVGTNEGSGRRRQRAQRR